MGRTAWSEMWLEARYNMRDPQSRGEHPLGKERSSNVTEEHGENLPLFVTSAGFLRRHD